jgi:hypothetical protein
MVVTISRRLLVANDIRKLAHIPLPNRRCIATAV